MHGRQSWAAALLALFILMLPACSRPAAPRPGETPATGAPTAGNPPGTPPAGGAPATGGETPVGSQPQADGPAFRRTGYGYELYLGAEGWLEWFYWLDGTRAYLDAYRAGPPEDHSLRGALLDAGTGTIARARNIGLWWFFAPSAWDEGTVASLGHSQQQTLLLTDLETGEVKQELPLGQYVLTVQREPGGAHLAYSLQHENPVEHLGPLRLLDVATGQNWQVAPVGWPVGFLADGRLLFARGERSGELGAVIPAEGAPPQVIHPDAHLATISPDGRKVAFAFRSASAHTPSSWLGWLRPAVAHASPTRVGERPNPQVDMLAVWDLETGSLVTQRLPFAGYLSYYGFHWSPDGRLLAAVIEETPPRELHRDASRKAAVVLFGRLEPLVVSPDRQILGYGWVDGHFYFSLGAAAGEQSVPEVRRRVTPDGAAEVWEVRGARYVQASGGFGLLQESGELQVYFYDSASRFKLNAYSGPPIAHIGDVSPAGWALLLLERGEGDPMRYALVKLTPQ